MKLHRSIIAFFSFLLFMQENKILTNYIDKTIDEKMYQAIDKSDIKKVANLLDQGSDPNSKSLWGSTNLAFAIMNNKIEIAELLLSKGANPNLKGDPGSNLPLIYAINQKNLPMVELLLKYKANPSYKEVSYEKSPIEFARMMLGYDNSHPIVILLLNAVEYVKNNEDDEI